MEGRRQQQRPPRASVPAFGGWEQGGAAPPDYSLDFTNIRAARMQRRRKAMSWSSFVGSAAAVEGAPPGGGGGDGGNKHHQWSSTASEGEDDRERQRRRHRHRHRRHRSHGADDREPIRPGRAADDPKGRGKFKGYLFGCVGGLW